MTSSLILFHWTPTLFKGKFVLWAAYFWYENQNTNAMKKLIFLLLLMLAVTTLLSAQGSIKGNVKTIMHSGQKDTIVAIQGIEVYVMSGSTKVVATTNLHGDFTLKPLDPGSYNVVINSVLIDTFIYADVRVSGSEMAFVKDVTIPYGRQFKKPLIIYGDPPLKNGNPTKAETKREEIQKMPDPGNLNNLIGLMGGAVYVSEDGKQISFKGSRLGDVLYIVDDVRMRGSDISIPNGAISSVSSWNGGAPARYGDFTGGVVIVETMGYFDWENQQIVRELIAKQEKEKAKEREAFKESMEQKE